MITTMSNMSNKICQHLSSHTDTIKKENKDQKNFKKMRIRKKNFRMSKELLLLSLFVFYHFPIIPQCSL